MIDFNPPDGEKERMGKYSFLRVGSAMALAVVVLCGLANQTQAGNGHRRAQQISRQTASQDGAGLSTDNLQNLVDTQGSLTIGDKIFSDFSFLASGLTNFDASKIQVNASVADGIYYLTWAGDMSLVSSGPDAVTADLLLKYRVTATSGLINMIDQLYTGSASPQGGAFLSVDETVKAGGVIVANSHLDGSDLSDPFAERGDNLEVDPGQSTLRVTKDIGFAVVNGGFVTVSEVSQSFHQVPEASTMIMLSLGLTLLGIVTFRQKLRS
jgi:hypothetical protein